MAYTVDSHQHFWKLGQFDYRWLDAPNLAPIRRDFLPDDLRPALTAAGIDRCVVVQTQHDLAENRWALDLAARHDFIAGVVGWVDLASPECERQVMEWKDQPKFVGVRHVTQDEPDDNFIVREDVLRGLGVLERHDVAFDLLFYVRHLRHAVTLAQRFPKLRMVIDHLSKPKIAQGVTDGWLEDLCAAARFPNVYCKLSGMVTEADWHQMRPDDLRPYVQAALEVFGAERCMFGSDWPVCLLAADYARVVQALNEALGPISTAQRDHIFGETARRFYRLAD